MWKEKQVIRILSDLVVGVKVWAGKRKKSQMNWEENKPKKHVVGGGKVLLTLVAGPLTN